MNENDLRLSNFRKPPSTEQRLAEMNKILQPLQASFETAVSPRLPVLFIIGPPRSGSTLMSQLIGQSGLFGILNNFVARFWLAPAVGAMIDRAISFSASSGESSFLNKHGVTAGWSEPHEFGYFWDRWFDFGQETHNLTEEERAQVDVAGLLRALASIENGFEKPLSFKNNTWCTFQADFIARCLPKALFVVCRRNSLFIAQSLMESRRERYGRDDLWWSLRPSRYREILACPCWEQVAWQALDVEREMEESVARIDPARVVDAGYSRLCNTPGDIIEEIRTRCAELGSPLPASAPLPATFRATDRQRLSDEEWACLVAAMETHTSRMPG
ncbi:MAG: sulfotransferase [Rhodospirillaceae bacterium]